MIISKAIAALHHSRLSHRKLAASGFVTGDLAKYHIASYADIPQWTPSGSTSSTSCFKPIGSRQLADLDQPAATLANAAQ